MLGHVLGAPFKMICHVLMAHSRPVCSGDTGRVLHEDDVLVGCGGGGVYIFWQFGAIRAILEARGPRYTRWAGSSAGAVCSTLAICGIDVAWAARAAFELGAGDGLFNSDPGARPALGSVIRKWLWHVLPDDAAERCDGRLTVQVTVWRGWRGFEVIRVGRFASNETLVDTLMCSLHIPWFIDGRAWARLQLDDGECVLACDGSIARILPLGVPHEKVDVMDFEGVQPDYLVSHTEDEYYRKGGPGFVDLLDLNYALDMMQRGYEFTQQRLADGMENKSVDDEEDEIEIDCELDKYNHCEQRIPIIVETM